LQLALSGQELGMTSGLSTQNRSSHNLTGIGSSYWYFPIPVPLCGLRANCASYLCIRLVKVSSTDAPLTGQISQDRSNLTGPVKSHRPGQISQDRWNLTRQVKSHKTGQISQVKSYKTG